MISLHQQCGCMMCPSSTCSPSGSHVFLTKFSTLSVVFGFQPEHSVTNKSCWVLIKQAYDVFGRLLRDLPILCLLSAAVSGISGHNLFDRDDFRDQNMRLQTSSPLLPRLSAVHAWLSWRGLQDWCVRQLPDTSLYRNSDSGVRCDVLIIRRWTVMLTRPTVLHSLSSDRGATMLTDFSVLFRLCQSILSHYVRNWFLSFFSPNSMKSEKNTFC